MSSLITYLQKNTSQRKYRTLATGENHFLLPLHYSCRLIERYEWTGGSSVVPRAARPPLPAPPRPIFFFNFMDYLGGSGQNNRLAHPFLRLVSPRLENPASATGMIQSSMTFTCPSQELELHCTV